MTKAIKKSDMSIHVWPLGGGRTSEETQDNLVSSFKSMKWENFALI